MVLNSLHGYAWTRKVESIVFVLASDCGFTFLLCHVRQFAFFLLLDSHSTISTSQQVATLQCVILQLVKTKKWLD